MSRKATGTAQTIRRELRHSENVVKNMYSRKRFNRFLRILGPGVVTGAADDDPSGIMTYSQAGAGLGFGLLWAFPIMYPLLLAVQESCSRIGAVTGKGLAAILKENYSKKVLYLAVFLVVMANVVNIGADFGAMASATRLLLPLPVEFLTISFAITVIVLEVFVPYKTYVKVLKWLAVVLFAYPITAFLIGLDWTAAIKATFIPDTKLDFEIIYIVVGLLGTTISPYLFFWDTSEVVEGEIATKRVNQSGSTPKVNKHFLRGIRLDNFVGMTLASVTAWFITVVCASVLFSNGVTDIKTAADAASALEPLVQGFPNAGLIAKLLFSVGIIGVGLLAVPVLAGSSSYAVSEAFGWKEGLYRKFKKARGFYVVIITATLVGLAINFLGIDPIQALLFAAVFNGISSVPLLWMISKVGNNAKVMGIYKNGRLSNFFVRLAFVVVAAAVVVLFYAVIANLMSS